MANKENNIQISNGLGDISTIRDILMGQQIDEYESKFVEMREELNKMEQHFIKRLDSLNVTVEDKSSGLEEEINQRFEKLEKLLANSIEKIERRIEKTSTDDKVRLGKMFAKISKQLLDE